MQNQMLRATGAVKDGEADVSKMAEAGALLWAKEETDDPCRASSACLQD